MSIKPILFSGPMVRAILDGRKTQTRRVLKHQPGGDDIAVLIGGVYGHCAPDGSHLGGGNNWKVHEVDDLLWVRENHYLTDDGYNEFAVYSTDTEEVKKHKIEIEKMCQSPAITHEWAARHLKQRPSIHMPRWASRITLKVTDVRVERLQDISEADAIAEGAELVGYNPFDAGPMVRTEHYAVKATPCAWFKDLWDSINATRNDGEYAWAKNPWVAAYTFEPIFKNVDQIGETK